MKIRSALFAVVVAALGAASCVNVADDRADADDAVGHARDAVMDVDVDDGLACVRGVSSGELRLRAQAPLPRIHVRVNDAAETLRLVLDAALPDATLEARVPGGGGLPVTEESGERRTQKRWVVRVPQGRAIDLVVHAPDEASRAPYRFASLADVQEAVDRVKDVYAKIDEDPTIRFVLFQGDLTQSGTRAQLERFEAEERALDVPLYPTLGNHELGASEVFFQSMYGRASLHFRFRGVDFTLLDSASATIAPKVYERLDGWLASSRGRVHVVGMHIPPFDPTGLRNGAFASRAEASKLVAKLAEGGVDVTLYGHIHSYYAYANAGIPAYVSGGGGAIPERFDGIGRHFLVLDVDPGATDADGRVLSVGVVRVDL